MAQINEHDKNHSLMINYLQVNQWLDFITIQGVWKYGNSTMTYSGAGLNPVICQEYESNCRMKLATYLILMKNELIMSCPEIA